MKDRREQGFCERMKIETPLGENREEVVDGHTIIAKRSKKIFQHSKGKVK